MTVRRDPELALSLRDEEGIYTSPKLRERLPFIPLPAGQCAWINTELVGQLVLADAQGTSESHDSLAKTPPFILERDVPEELNDLGDKVKAW